MKIKQIIIGTIASVFMVGLNSIPAFAASTCATIKDGTITDIKGNIISSGYDQYGYNYQAHMFNGYYDNFARPNVPVTSGDKLIMKWSDSWLANVDCNGDDKLDRGLVDGVVGGTSLGWLTNQVNGSYMDENDEIHHYTDFVKIVWTGLGSPLWGQYTIIQEICNDPTGGSPGCTDSSLHLTKVGAPGFGLDDHWTQ